MSGSSANERGDVRSLLAPLVVVSPHCDDAVLSCGDLLHASPDAVVVTIFAASPEVGTPLTPWDEAGGFAPGDDVMAARRREDRAALAVLGARPVWLEFRDAQYGPSPRPRTVADRLELAVRSVRPGTVVIPLGLVHPDHVLAHEACMIVARRRPGVLWLAYEDAVYRAFPDAPVEQRLRVLQAAGLEAQRLELGRGPAGNAKRTAIACYQSQLRALSTPAGPGYTDAFAPERYWRLTIPVGAAARDAGCG